MRLYRPCAANRQRHPSPGNNSGAFPPLFQLLTLLPIFCIYLCPTPRYFLHSIVFIPGYSVTIMFNIFVFYSFIYLFPPRSRILSISSAFFIIIFNRLRNPFRFVSLSFYARYFYKVNLFVRFLLILFVPRKFPGHVRALSSIEVRISLIFYRYIIRHQRYGFQSSDCRVK